MELTRYRPKEPSAAVGVSRLPDRTFVAYQWHYAGFFQPGAEGYFDNWPVVFRTRRDLARYLMRANLWFWDDKVRTDAYGGRCLVANRLDDIMEWPDLNDRFGPKRYGLNPRN